MLKAGVFGAGHLGKIHIKLIKEISFYELVGFYDINPEIGKQVSEQFQIPYFEDADELLNSVDVVDIVTPTLFHYEYAKRAIKNQKHVFIEKPLTHTLEEGRTLIELSHESKVKVQVGHVERFNPAFLASQEHIKNPMFIEAHRLAIFNPRGTDVSVVLDLMIHDLDIILNVVKSPVRKIYASGVSVVSDSPDICNARIEFDNGCVANITASRISMKNMRKIRFFQSNSYVSVDFLDKKAEIFELTEIKENDVRDEFDLIIPVNQGKNHKKIKMDMPLIPEINSIKMELEEFAKAILNDTRPKVTIEEGYYSLEIAFAILKKIEQA